MYLQLLCQTFTKENSWKLMYARICTICLGFGNFIRVAMAMGCSVSKRISACQGGNSLPWPCVVSRTFNRIQINVAESLIRNVLGTGRREHISADNSPPPPSRQGKGHRPSYQCKWDRTNRLHSNQWRNPMPGHEPCPSGQIVAIEQIIKSYTISLFAVQFSFITLLITK